MPASDQGHLHGRYSLIPRTLIFLTCGEEVLLLKGAERKRLWPGHYNGLGGHVERGEDVLTSARRELFEEAGLSVPDLWLCGTVTVNTEENPDVVIFVLRGEYCPDDHGQEPFTSPDGTLEWVSFSKVYDLPLVEDLPVLLPRVLATGRGDPPFSAHTYYVQTGKLVIAFSE